MWRFGCHPEEKEPTRLIGKFYQILVYGRINFSMDRRLRRFVSSFMKDREQAEKMRPFYQYSDTRSAAKKTIQIKEMQAQQLEHFARFFDQKMDELGGAHKKINTKIEEAMVGWTGASKYAFDDQAIKADKQYLMTMNKSIKLPSLIKAHARKLREEAMHND